jgi:dihydroorotate dehydrogenase (NAD+) catalytic subunit
MAVDMTIYFAGVKLSNPVFTASGTCGYADELYEYADIDKLGGFITKSITPEARRGNATPRMVETDAGMLNAIGLANIGLERFVEEKLSVLGQMKPAVFVNAAGYSIEDYVRVAERLSGREEIAGFELNISCPNVKQGGITFGTDPVAVERITREFKKACGAKAVIVKLTPAVTDISVTASAAIAGGADALSLVNTWTAMVIDIETQQPVLANRTGGLSGPAIRPMAVYLVNKVYNEVARAAGVPILGLGGIVSASDAIEFMLAGATAVGVGTASFIDPRNSVAIVEGMRAYCDRKGIAKVSELTGLAG